MKKTLFVIKSLLNLLVHAVLLQFKEDVLDKNQLKWLFINCNSQSTSIMTIERNENISLISKLSWAVN